MKNEHNKTRTLSEKASHDLRQIKSMLAQLMYQALRDKRDSQIKFIAHEIEMEEKEINRILGSEYTEFIPPASQSKIILEIKSALTFSKLYLK